MYMPRRVLLLYKYESWGAVYTEREPATSSASSSAPAASSAASASSSASSASSSASSSAPAASSAASAASSAASSHFYRRRIHSLPKHGLL